MKPAFILLFILNTLLCLGQEEFKDYKRYDLQDIPKTQIEVNAPINTVLTYFLNDEEENAVLIQKNKYQLFVNYQSFITKEQEKQATANDPPNKWLYTHDSSIASLWEVTFKEEQINKTIIEFELKSALTENKTRAYFNNEFISQDDLWRKYYLNHKLVSRGIIENIFEISFRQKLLPELIVVDFDEKMGFDNKYYKITDLTPKTGLKPSIQLFKKVPPLGESPVNKSFLIYDRDNSSLSLLDFESGKVIWKRQLENLDNSNFNNFNVYNNTIYVAVSMGYIYAISLKTGEVYWKFSPQKLTNQKYIKRLFKQSLPISDDYIFVNYDGIVYKVNRYDGQIVWSQNIGRNGHYNYSFDNDNLYKTGVLECFIINKKTGKVNKIIQNTQSNPFYNTHILDIEDNNIYLSDERHLYSYDLKTDKIIWKYQDEARDLIKENNVLYANTLEFDLLAIDSKTGKVIWKKANIKQTNVTNRFTWSMYNLKDEILLNIETTNYSDNSRGKQLVWASKKDGNINHIINITEENISNPLIEENNIILLTPSKIISIDLTTKILTEKAIDLSSIKNKSNKKRVYELYTQIIEAQ